MPNQMVRTNIPMIDLFNSLVVSQKLPIFARAGEPYNELLARIAALLRRALLAAPQSAADTFAFGAATVDASTLTVTASDGTSQRLLPRELGLLKLFAENPGKVFSRDDLLDRFWGVSYYGTTRTLDQRLMLLRTKLGSDAARIESVHGVGYKYVPAGGS
jgi:DNA-binding response OmpR family regulator